MVKETLEAPYSHYLFDAGLSREIDQRTINEAGIDGFTLMEIAGSSAAKLLLQEKQLTHGIYLCGKGNNAGDALVVARYLTQNNIDATIIFLSGSGDLSTDTKKNFELLKKFNPGHKPTFFEGWEQFNPSENFDFIIDGMLGTGLASNVRDTYAKAIEWANKQSCPIYSMDIPTGLQADTGRVMGSVVKADATFTFGGRKSGLYLGDGPDKTGTIHYCELPFPNTFKDKCNTFLLDTDWIQLPTPTLGEHKYRSGVLYIIAGSEGLTGAAIMAARSAWSEGLGAVILICPRGTLSIYEQTLPSIIKKPVGNRNDFFFKAEHTGEVLDILSEKEGALLIGPGLGRDESTVTFIDSILPHNTYPTVIDADGLWSLAQIDNLPAKKTSDWILTPHPGELNALTKNLNSSQINRLQTVRKYTKATGVTVLSKGMPGIIGTPAGKCYLTNYNTNYFSRAGSGDVLAGKVGAYLASGNSFVASCAFGLMNGKRKLDHFLSHHSTLPEPIDFI